MKRYNLFKLLFVVVVILLIALLCTRADAQSPKYLKHGVLIDTVLIFSESGVLDTVYGIITDIDDTASTGKKYYLVTQEFVEDYVSAYGSSDGVLPTKPDTFSALVYHPDSTEAFWAVLSESTTSPGGVTGDIQYDSAGHFSAAPMSTDGIDIVVDNNLTSYKIIIGNGNDTTVIDSTIRQYYNGELVFSTNKYGYISQDYSHNGYRDVVIGYKAYNLFNGLGYNNVAIGEDALYSGNGNDNVAIGMKALYTNVNSGNTAIGSQAMQYNSSGNFNSALGIYSLRNNTSGEYNIAVGPSSLFSNTTGHFNIALGTSTLSVSNGSNNVSIGHGSGYWSNGNNNIYIGSHAADNLTSYSNRLVISSMNFGSISADTNNSIIYGYQDASTANQRLYFNSNVFIKHDIEAAQYKLSSLNTAPSSSSDTGELGEIRIVSDYIYICIATDTWVRVALNTW